MKITLEADYAVRIVYVLSKARQRMDAKSISEATQVTLRFSLKILRKLVGAGIVRSYKGAQGGYELARPPAEVSILEVLETVEGPLVISRCGLPDYNCGHEFCAFAHIFHNASTIFSEYFSGINLENIDTFNNS